MSVSLMPDSKLTARREALLNNIEKFKLTRSHTVDRQNRRELDRAIRVSGVALAEVEREMNRRREFPPHLVHGERTRKA